MIALSHRGMMSIGVDSVAREKGPHGQACPTPMNRSRVFTMQAMIGEKVEKSPIQVQSARRRREDWWPEKN
jgi:hypothetical protein